MSFVKVSWIWIWIPTKEYESSKRCEAEMDTNFAGETSSFEELVDNVKKDLVYRKRETSQYSLDGKFKLVQFCVKDEVKFYTAG